MKSLLTVRLPNDLDREISDIAEKLHLKRSDIIRLALKKFLEEFRDEEERKPYDMVKNLIGKISSNIPDLGEAHRKYLIQKFKNHA